MPAECSEERIQAMKQCNGNGKRLIVFSINIKESDTKKVHSIMKKPVGSIQGERDIG